MKKIGVIVFIAILLIGFFIVQQVTQTEIKISGQVVNELKQEDNVRVYIKLKDSVIEDKGIASDTKQELEDSVNIKHEFDDKVSAIISSEELDELKNNPDVESIEIVRTRNILLQDSVGQINANETWSSQLNGINLTGKHETVCIIDTGVNYNHSDLGGCFGEGCKVIGGYDYCADDVNCTTSDADPMGVHWHGTHVAGIVAANGDIKGVAPDANLIVIKASNSTGTFWDDDLEKAIDWCVNNASTYNISVISMSLGEGLYSEHCDDPLEDSLNNAFSNNISVVIATGNDGSTSQIAAPSCHQNVIPVGAIAKDDSTFYYNRNNLVLLVAPGREINSTVLEGYQNYDGTSMSTPHVAGAIALINQFRRLEGSAVFTPSEIEDVLNDSGERIYDSGSNITYSRIDILATLNEIESSVPEITMNSPSNNEFSSNENQTFNCSVTDVLQLSNITFFLWNESEALIYNKTENISGNFNTSVFNYTFVSEGAYEWNCEAYYNDSNSIKAPSNYTITYDNTNPIVSLISPDNGADEDEGSITFRYNVTDDNDIENCNLLIDSTIEDEEEVVNRGETISMSASLLDGSYDWKINCIDVAENIGTSSIRDIEVIAPTDDDDGGDDDDDDDDDDSSSVGGGAETGVGATSFLISDSDFEKGINKYMKEGDSMKFNSNEEDHILKVDSYDNNSVQITIESDPITLNISLEETEKVDLNNDNIYDIEVQYLIYVNNLAKIQIKEMNETIPTRTIQDSSNISTNNTIGTGEVTSEDNEPNAFRLSGRVTELWEKVGKKGHIIFYISLGIIVVGILGVLGYYNKERLSVLMKKVYKKKREEEPKDL